MVKGENPKVCAHYIRLLRDTIFPGIENSQHFFLLITKKIIITFVKVSLHHRNYVFQEVPAELIVFYMLRFVNTLVAVCTRLMHHTNIQELYNCRNVRSNMTNAHFFPLKLTFFTHRQFKCLFQEKYFHNMRVKFIQYVSTSRKSVF